jgi:hypothetical protein
MAIALYGINTRSHAAIDELRMASSDGSEGAANCQSPAGPAVMRSQRQRVQEQPGRNGNKRQAAGVNGFRRVNVAPELVKLGCAACFTGDWQFYSRRDSPLFICFEN